MPHSPGKYCIDRNLVKWYLLEGVITRKTADDGPFDGKQLPARRVTGIEKRLFTKVERQPFGRQMLLLGTVLVVVAWMSAPILVRAILGLAGLLLMFLGVERSRARRTVFDAFQLQVPGENPADWLLLGSTPEILGFIEGVQTEMAGNADVIRA